MGLISINLDIMSPKKRLFAVSAFFCLTPVGAPWREALRHSGATRRRDAFLSAWRDLSASIRCLAR